MTRKWIATKHTFHRIWIASETSSMKWSPNKPSDNYRGRTMCCLLQNIPLPYCRYIYVDFRGFHHGVFDKCLVTVGSPYQRYYQSSDLSKETNIVRQIYYVVRFWIIDQMTGGWHWYIMVKTLKSAMIWKKCIYDETVGPYFRLYGADLSERTLLIYIFFT